MRCQFLHSETPTSSDQVKQEPANVNYSDKLRIHTEMATSKLHKMQNEG
jgi:hypothetical protein